ncbi:hypothetical protein HDU76_000041 [Blyttiomyces sp. JEL0837]|nr:hypothetical protein HDU76_000041 [Blyttiomyces sp. JEL0837]
MPSPEASTNERAAFSLPEIVDNPIGWGPSKIPYNLTQIPYAPFSKSDRIGKIADWTAPADGAYPDQRGGQQSGAAIPGSVAAPGALGQDGMAPARTTRRNFRMGPEAFGTGTASAFAFSFAADEEASFSVVDRGAGVKKTTGSGFKSSRGGSRSFGRGGGAGATSQYGRGGFGFGRGGYGKGGRGGFSGQRRGYNDKPQRLRDASVQVGNDWKILEEIDFNRLTKLYYEVDEAEDVAANGCAFLYDKTFDRVSTKFEKPLQQTDKVHYNVTSSGDPVLQELSQSAEGPVVLATDNILSTLMCASKSVYSWDIVITKYDNKIFIDKRDGANFDFVTINENAAEPPMEGDKDSLNTPSALAQEATHVLKSYSQQVLKDADRYVLPTASPFDDGESLASGINRYRKWNLGDDISLIVRTTIDAVVQAAGANSLSLEEALEGSLAPESTPQNVNVSDVLFATVKAVNEFDSRAPGAGGAPDWRQKLDSQRGAVMATEIKNNGNKLARWTTEALLAGVDQIRVGFVSRLNSKDRARHTILGSTFFKPKEFAGQINLSLGNGWGILKTFVDLVLKYDDGKYVMLKDPNKPMIRLYSVPASTFEEDDEKNDDAETEA